MTQSKINVAPSSTSGHYITKTQKVINLDNINETFLVEEPAELVTENHTTLIQQEKGLITCQMVYNPFAKMFEKSYD
ncbi:hypothetical protein [Chryseobacterium proteolyticum]|uniref:hypothetical protein n=1 Tax=Chryseobacterium proteolyticum TaxID=118127 RepID=UPI003983BAB9